MAQGRLSDTLYARGCCALNLHDDPKATFWEMGFDLFFGIVS